MEGMITEPSRKSLKNKKNRPSTTTRRPMLRVIYQAKKSSMLSEEAALQVVQVPSMPTDSSTSSCVGKGSDAGADESGRERLKRHRIEMGGQVWVPDTGGQENLLKNRIDCTSFDASLVNNSILSAQAALMQQRATTRSTNNLTLHTRIQINRC